jgi:hypothetical protein
MKYPQENIEHAGKRTVLKDYLKYRLYFLPAILVLFLLFHYSVADGYNSFFFCGIFIVDIIQGYYRYENRRVYLSDLNKKGLTETEVINAEFMKEWGKRREEGPLKYCLVNGGIIAGALLSLLVSFIWFTVLSKNNKPAFADGPGQIFQFIGITYLIGAIIGFISYRITGSVKQEKFERLTTPLH